jgi:hypothetical protein
MAELRFQRIGLLDHPIAELSTGRRLLLVAEAYGGKLLGGFLSLLTLPLRLLGFFRPKRLTDTYLSDPQIRDRLLGPQTDDEPDEGGTPGDRPRSKLGRRAPVGA